MTRQLISELMKMADTAEMLDADLLHRVAGAMRPLFPNAPTSVEGLSDPTDAVLHLVDKCLPGWSIALKGKAIEPDGHWSCVLRESSNRDNDEVIGIGKAPTVALALLKALLKVAHQRSPG